jgi:hypothetical protein
LIGSIDIRVRARGGQDHRRDHLQVIILFDVRQNLVAIHFGKGQIQQYQGRAGRVRVTALLLEKSHGLLAVDSHMQIDRAIDVAEGLLHEAGFASTVFNQKDI